MSRADRERWDGKHAVSTANEPSAAVVRFADRIPRHGRVLDLACGTGRNALYLAVQREVRVDAVDISFVALETLRAAARRIERAAQIQPLQVDLDEPAWDQQGPSAGRYAAILIISYLARPLFPALTGLLAPRGLLLIDTFDRSYLAKNPRFKPDFVLEPEELPRAFSHLEVLHHSSHDGRTTFLAVR